MSMDFDEIPYDCFEDLYEEEEQGDEWITIQKLKKKKSPFTVKESEEIWKNFYERGLE